MNISNIKWSNSGHTVITCNADHPEYGNIPISVTADYDTQFGRDVFTAALSGSFGPIAEYSAPAPTVPERIEALNGLLVLDQAGLSSAYTAWANAPERTFAQRAFIDKAMTWRRDDPTLNAAATDLGLSSAQVDALFIQAAT